MRRFLLASLICFGMLSFIVAADTPGEEAIKNAIKVLKEKRAMVNDRADQALLDTAVKDLEERLAQVGKGEAAPEAKKDEPFAMPKGWELKFNTGKTRPTFDPKTGVLKLAYDFSDAKQFKDFEYADEVKPTVLKGVLTVKGGDSLQHRVKFVTLSVACEVMVGAPGEPVQTSEGYALFVGPNGQRQTVVDVRSGGAAKTFIAGGPLGVNAVGGAVTMPLKNWSISETKVGVVAGTLDRSGKKTDGKAAGRLILTASNATNTYRNLTVTGVIDPEWAKEFFADKK